MQRLWRLVERRGCGGWRREYAATEMSFRPTPSTPTVTTMPTEASRADSRGTISQTITSATPPSEKAHPVNSSPQPAGARPSRYRGGLGAAADGADGQHRNVPERDSPSAASGCAVTVGSSRRVDGPVRSPACDRSSDPPPTTNRSRPEARHGREIQIGNLRIERVDVGWAKAARSIQLPRPPR